MPLSSNGTSPLDNQSNSGPGWSFSSATKPSTDTELYMTTLPTGLSFALGCANISKVSCRSCENSIGRQRPAVQRVAGMFAQEPPPDFDVPGRREPGERLEVVAEVGLVEVACATGEVGPVNRFGRV